MSTVNGVGTLTVGNAPSMVGLSLGRADALTIDNTTNPPTVRVNGAPITGGASAGLWRYFTGSNVDNTVQLDPAATGYDATAALLYPVANAEATGPPPFMLFEPDRGGALRAGAPTGAVWTAANRGVGSVAFGAGTTAAGAQSVVCGGVANSAAGAQSAVGGGSNNSASATAGTVGGGGGNTASGPYTTVAGGDRNNATVQFASVVGGQLNNASGLFATVGGGISNSAAGQGAVVCGGQSSLAQGAFATVAGGISNQASGPYSFCCGRSNFATGSDAFCAGVGCRAEGDASFAVGASCLALGASCFSAGTGNTAGGVASICLGQAADNAIDTDNYYNNCFVWSDSSGLVLSSVSGSSDNSFNVGAIGGTRFWSDSSRTTGVELPAGGNSWSSVCDRDAKENLVELDSADVLARVERLPLFAYNYKGTDAGLVCRGPMAQDWHALFPSAKNPLRIDTGDLDGITLAAVKGLAAKVSQLERAVSGLRCRSTRRRSAPMLGKTVRAGAKRLRWARS